MNKKMLIGFSVMILLARFIYALGTPSFIDTADADFSAGTLHLTNISGSGANANVTLNSTIINTFRAYNLSGNFTSQIFDTNSTNSIFDKIEWSRVLANSSDVLGYAMDTGAGDIGA